MALTTKVEELIASRSNGRTAYVSYRQGGDQKSSRFISIDAWRMVKTTPSVIKNGKTWFWCPHHSYKGKYDGLYVTHKPEDHDEWQKKKDASLQRKRNYKAKMNQENKDSQHRNDDSKKLVLTDTLKAVLLTHSDMTGAQVEELIADVGQTSDF